MEEEKKPTLEQTKSTNVASSSPMYSMIFLLIHGRILRSISICKRKQDWRTKISRGTDLKSGTQETKARRPEFTVRHCLKNKKIK